MTVVLAPRRMGLERALASRSARAALAAVLLVGLIALVSIASLGAGAVAIPPERVVGALAGSMTAAPADPEAMRDALVVLGIRLPRLLLGLMVGAALAVAGALMQGLFQNPLADPGLVGVSAGAGLAAAAMIVLGDVWLSPLMGALPFAALPFAAFAGGLACTLLLYGIATRRGRTSVPTLLLAGIAIGALAGALTGVLAYLSDDRQLRDLTFWSLGSLSGATWTKVAALTPIVLPLLLLVPFLGRGLNALSLGEAEAFHLGVPVQRLKLLAILAAALAVGAGVAAAGVIGFVGIVVPHLIRLALGPDHRWLLPLSAGLGGALLVAADIIARTLVAPSELPIGIVTAALGAPFFLWLLLARNRGLA
jgi:iron complex transport system permease protein